MTSSTSHSRIPKLAAILFGFSLLAMIASVLYTLRCNAEIAFLTGASSIKQAYATKLTADYGKKVVVVGGSGCGFSIDGRRMLQEHRIPLVNFGLHAGIGASVLTWNALTVVNDGDTLVVSMEPNLLEESSSPPTLGVQFAFARLHPEWITQGDMLGANLSWPSALLTLRPGGYHVVTMIGKWIQGRPMYRYQIRNVDESGWMQTEVRATQLTERVYDKAPSESGRRLLTGIRNWCEKHNVRVAYCFPWTYVPREKLNEFKNAGRRFAGAVIDVMPVLKDENFGAYSIRDHFADTELHLTAEGAAARTDALAAQIKNWSLWKPSELKSEQPPFVQ